MKPLLLLALGLTLVLTACGAGSGPAPQVTSRGSDVIDYRPHVHRSSVTPLANRREARAGREAERLLKRIPLPPGAARLGQAPPASDPLSQSGLGVSIVSMTADRYSYWRVPESGRAVIAFERRHMLPGLHGEGTGSSPGGWASEEFDGPVVAGSPKRAVSVTVEPYGGGFVLRLDAGVAWIYPRSPKEVVPATVREVDVHGGGVARRVTDPAQVRRIVRWFDALHVVQPGPAVNCPLELAARIRLGFRSAGGTKLAGAVLPSQPATNCNSIRFTSRGAEQTPLIDATWGTNGFAGRVQRLLGVRFSEPRR